MFCYQYVIMKKAKKLEISYQDVDVSVPYFRYTSKKKWKRIAIIACTHGDEINWIKIIYDFKDRFENTIWKKFQWEVLLIPVVNVLWYIKWKRKIPVDNIDLNRSFFDKEPINFTTHFGYTLFHELLKEVDLVVDIHDAWERDILAPHSRFYGKNTDSRTMAKLLWTKIAVNRWLRKWMLAKVLHENGIGSITVEVGWDKRYDKKWQKVIHTWLIRILDHFNFFTESYKLPKLPNIHEMEVYKRRYAFIASTTWLVELDKELNDVVIKWETVWSFFNPITQREVDLISPVNGIVFSLWKANSVYAWAKIISFLVDDAIQQDSFDLWKSYKWLCTFTNSPM